MAYRMWKPNKSNDYKTIDRQIGERYRVGGVDMWLYTYAGAITGNSTDITKNNSSGALNELSDLVLGETPFRKYNIEAITLPVVYQIQEATPDLKLNGLFFFESMDITLHYNTMIQMVGRKILPGDVIELANLRDEDVMGKDTGINRFFQVQDAFKTAEGYSATWLAHIYKIRVVPLTDSPEFSDLLGSNNNNYPDNPDDPNNGNGNSTGDGSSNSSYDTEIAIMNAIVRQADNEAPYIHWTNEHIYDDQSSAQVLDRDIQRGFEFPTVDYNMYFWKMQLPELYEKQNNTWVPVQASYGSKLPQKANDGDFFFLENITERSSYTLYQYYRDEKNWINCILPYSTTVVNTDDDFYVKYYVPVLYQYSVDDKEWRITDDSLVIKPFTTKDITGNLHIHDDVRPSIPPARGDVGEGTQFPSSPEDGEYFYRIDYTPITLWQYSSSTNKWSQFNYGGRLPWVGANYERIKFVNSQDAVNIHDVVKPNTLYRKPD